MNLIDLESKIIGESYLYEIIYGELLGRGFVLGGNWDHEGGSFDKSLDEQGMYWLRLPFRVVVGRFDPAQFEETSGGGTNVTIAFESALILHHERRTHSDPSAEVQLLGGLVDQFQSVAVKDGAVDEQWVVRGKELLIELERKLIK